MSTIQITLFLLFEMHAAILLLMYTARAFNFVLLDVAYTFPFPLLSLYTVEGALCVECRLALLSCDLITAVLIKVCASVYACTQQWKKALESATRDD